MGVRLRAASGPKVIAVVAAHYSWGFVVAALFVAALCGLLGLLMRASSQGARVFQEGHVTGVVGRKGHGKTLFSVHEMLRHVGTPIRCRECSAVEGKAVRHAGFIATNGGLKVPGGKDHLYRHVESWNDLLDLPHGTLVVIDEAHLWAPATNNTSLLPHVRWLLSQCRKLHIEIMWVSQRESRVTVGLRDQTDELAICRKSYLRQMKVSFYEPEMARVKGEKALWVYRYRVTKKLAAAYDTYELLKPEGDDVDSQSAHLRAVSNKRGVRETDGAEAPAQGVAVPAVGPLVPSAVDRFVDVIVQT